LIWVFPRRFGVGAYPSSQMYSSLNFVIRVSHELMKRVVSEPCLPGNQRRTRPPTAGALEAFRVPIEAKDAPNAVQQQRFATAAMLAKEARLVLLIL
jgi:hypothetical protein